MGQAADAQGSATGARLGPYVLGEKLGAGGMGVVFRARDDRLGRDVAIKVLPEAFRSPERQRRFVTEARAAAALSHTNVLAVYDVSTDAEQPYLVTELLDGQSLADVVEKGPLPTRRALALVAQAARGLAAAHERGIVHRDLKPSNLFVTRDGTVKVLDFGLAKLATEDASTTSETVTSDRAKDPSTGEGTVLGTVGYMSPEQVQGKAADARSDIFALGCVLYELLSGKRAFFGPTAIDTSHAVLRGDPAPLPAHVPQAVARLCARCLQKEPAERFQSARDLAFALDALEGDSGTSSQPSAGALAAPAPKRRWMRPVVGVATIVALGIAWLAGRSFAPRPAAPAAEGASAAPHDAAPAPRFTQITFRPGAVFRARFAPDGTTVVYTEVHDSRPQVYSATPGNPEARPISPPSTSLLDLSSLGEMALAIADPSGKWTLARAQMSGGAPRPVLDGVAGASWSPDGSELLVVRNMGNVRRIEYPISHVVLETDAYTVNARLAPDGSRRIALVRQLVPSHAIGRVELVEADGTVKQLTKEYPSCSSLAWTPDGREIWFTTGDSIESRTLRAVTPDGRDRVVFESPVDIQIADIAPGGRALVSTGTSHHRVAGLLAGSTRETDLSWFEWSDRPDLSADGKHLLTAIVGNASPDGEPLTYLRDSETGTAVQLSHGIAHALSPDGRFALVAGGAALSDLSLVPTGVGTPQPLARGSIELVTRGFFFPDGKKLLLVGHERDRPPRVWVLELAGGSPVPVSDEGVLSACPPSPDGKWIAGFTAEHRAVMIPTAGGAARPIDKLADGELPIGWTDGGRGLFVRRIDRVERLDGYVTTGAPVKIDRFDLARGVLTPWHELVPGDPGGRVHVDDVTITPDGRFYAYAYGAFTSTLYVAQGLR